MNMFNPPDNDIIDIKAVLERIGGDKDFLTELINIYCEDFQGSYTALIRALEERDFTAIQELGHSLKGSAANLSLSQLNQKAYQVENAGRDQDWEQARLGVEGLKYEFERLQEYLAE